MKLKQAISGIREADKSRWQEALENWNSLAKPLGSLGLLEEMICAISGLTGDPDVQLNHRTLLVLCADNGVVDQGISQSDATVTAAVTRALGAGTSTVNYMAQAAHCKVVPVDLGVKDFPGANGVLSQRVKNGTGDISEGPALTREECIRAIEIGISLVEKEKDASILLTGEMGIGNTTTSSAVACALLEQNPIEMTGRGAGLSDSGLERKILTIQKSLIVNKPDSKDPIDVLQKVGGLDLAGLCGVCIGGAYFRVPILLDGLITVVAALCAVRLCPDVRCALLASHMPAEPAGVASLEAMNLRGPISAELRLGEGSGAVAALSLLDQALAVYHSGHTFSHLGIAPYINL